MRSWLARLNKSRAAPEERRRFPRALEEVRLNSRLEASPPPAPPFDPTPVKPESRRLLLVASSGGHWVQLARLSPAFAGHDALYVATARGALAPSGGRPVRVVMDAARDSPLRLMALTLQLLWILLRFRPDWVISTGAAPGLLALRLGKSLGSRTIWIDSLANCEELSLSGRLARPHADLCLTQWPHLASETQGPYFWGSVL